MIKLIHYRILLSLFALVAVIPIIFIDSDKNVPVEVIQSWQTTTFGPDTLLLIPYMYYSMVILLPSSVIALFFMHKSGIALLIAGLLAALSGSFLAPWWYESSLNLFFSELFWLFAGMVVATSFSIIGYNKSLKERDALKRAP